MELARLIDAALLRPDATPEDVIRFCEEAASLRCAAAVVLPIYLDLCVRVVEGSETSPCVAVGFPTGGLTRALLEVEVEEGISLGARELDMVMPLGLFRSGRHGEVVEHLHAAAAPVHEEGALLKVILETGQLSEEEMRRAAGLAVDAGADFVKTSTGVYGGGATPEAVRLLRSAVPPTVGVKASGGISTHARALEMVEAGAGRIGTSTAAVILAEARAADSA